MYPQVLKQSNCTTIKLQAQPVIPVHQQWLALQAKCLAKLTTLKVKVQGDSATFTFTFIEKYLFTYLQKYLPVYAKNELQKYEKYFKLGVGQNTRKSSHFTVDKTKTVLQ